MNHKNALFLIRLAVATIFLSHSLHGVFNHTVNEFGKSYLDTVGFAPFGIYFAWGLMAFEIIGSILLIFGKYLKLIVPVFISILLIGIILVHYKEGWYVVGPGRNGMEFSFVLIVSLIAVTLPARKVKYG